MKDTMKFSLKTRLSVLLSTVFLGACSSVVSYKAPLLDSKHVSTLPSISTSESIQRGTPSALWWKQFGDIQLDDLVELAWRNNYDLRTAVARLSGAREQLQVSQSAIIPNASVDAGSSHNKLAAIESRSGTSAIVSPIQWQMSLAWELDLFGRVRHSIDAAQASVEERSALHDDVRRVILAHVVEAYLDLRGAQMLRASIQAQVDNQTSSLKLIRDREIFGGTLSSERLRFETQLRLLSSRLPSLIAQERSARNRLATLTGQRLDAPQLTLLDQPVSVSLPQTLMTDEPVQLLFRRPDVKAAERALAVATAREGIAYAELFPRISLSALFGNSGVAGNWLGGDANRWRMGATTSWSLFDAGARRAQFRAAGADVQAALANFDKVVAIALEEADTSLSTWVQLRKRNEELSTAYIHAQASVRLSRLRYDEGMESLLSTLEAERIALAAGEQLVSAKRDFAMGTARSYFVLAGGFDVGNVVTK
ncbi:efflux transporter outer membrane subunit [Undibacterium sp. Di24W]|uniref:efflux transporter outer membrane subunit n=1 Tax=Undibacterium sp. Di24W TaxID=3413033 RepID=UPI003BF5E3F2